MRARVKTLLVALVSLSVVGAGGWWFVGRANAPGPDGANAPVIEAVSDSSARAPDGVRVRVRVLNGTSTSGLARRGTQRLRDHGYDVIDYSTAPKPSAETLIEVTAASREWGVRIARALGGGTVREHAEPLPYADVVVTLGSDWKPPAQPFRP